MNLDDYNGDCTIVYDHTGDHLLIDRPVPLRITRADLHIRISPDLLDEVKRGGHPDATVNGDVFRVVGVNRTVEYRIGDQVIDGFGHSSYLADRIDPPE